VILDTIAAAKRRAHEKRDPVEDRARCQRLEGALPPLRSLAASLAADFSSPVPRVIAEFKRRSPSAQTIRPDADVATIVAEYARAGAAALSVLTDNEFFGGDLSDLATAREVCGPAPILRKDFILFEEDLVDARLAGADAVLLIVRLLPDAALAALHEAAVRLGLEVLVEVHSDEECRRAVGFGARLVGVNHRDLDTLTISLDLSARLASLLPAGVVRVAESGLRSGADLRLMRARGYHAVLVGETLMRAPSPGAQLAALLRGEP
jgi:indole-3-glycerol phosphate synthase